MSDIVTELRLAHDDELIADFVLDSCARRHILQRKLPGCHIVSRGVGLLKIGLALLWFGTGTVLKPSLVRLETSCATPCPTLIALVASGIFRPALLVKMVVARSTPEDFAPATY